MKRPAKMGSLHRLHLIIWSLMTLLQTTHCGVPRLRAVWPCGCRRLFVPLVAISFNCINYLWFVGTPLLL